jgi:hypothetical protein
MKGHWMTALIALVVVAVVFRVAQLRSIVVGS